MKNTMVRREEGLPVLISSHMEKRLRERKGLNRKAIKRHILRALDLGDTIQKSIENNAKKIIKLFRGDYLIFYIEKDYIHSVTILTDNAIEERTTYYKRVRKKKVFKYVLVRGVEDDR